MPTDFRRIVAAALAARSWSESELARRSGVSQQRINRFRSGKTALGSDALGRVFDALDLRVTASGKPFRAPARADRAA